MSGPLESILERGGWAILSDPGRQARLVARTRDAVLAAVGGLCGAPARDLLESGGLERLHEHLPAERIGLLRDRVLSEVREELLRFACEIGREFLGLRAEFFVDDYTILRVSYPHEVAIRAGQDVENPGTGRVHPAVLDRESSARRRDPAYDPRAHNRYLSPASWAHGPHKDTWAGHTVGGINLWLAITRVTAENGMMFFPGTFGREFGIDRRSLSVEDGSDLPGPRMMAMEPGELLVFNPELLHATRLNTSPDSRLALSARLNPARPRFSRRCFYAREFWHSSVAIEEGRMDDILQFPRDDNLADPGPDLPAPDRPSGPVLAAVPGEGGGWRLSTNGLDPSSRSTLVELPGGERIVLLRTPAGYRGVGATCPHLGRSLAGGALCGCTVQCPTHGLVFDLDTGASASPMYSLETFRVTRAGEWLEIERERE